MGKESNVTASTSTVNCTHFDHAWQNAVHPGALMDTQYGGKVHNPGCQPVIFQEHHVGG